eukprot:gnl/MRDRNA2_/MRDRNA2_214532_c0_seq1.p1 gnl/MRDRNA2_/MRDRNA2_214532_c0~~gnl/MRDRNA2_/MRDRNA2_214532_c0_seq1.p1  ORF type:complete len:281 (+),score=41.64 gnl/MRDRNA2_/MRDRNA2_214532_c0_seq1:74-844(+)
MTNLRKLNQATNKQFSLLRRFLKERGISIDLSIRIRKYLEHRIHAQKSNVQEHDIGILVLLSKPLQKELQEQTYKPIICEHPFFAHYSKVCPEAVSHLCHLAFSPILFSEGDKVFTEGSKCEQMIFVMEGKLLYRWYGKDGKSREQYLQEGDSCAEACLWAEHTHAGTLQAVTMSKLIEVDVAKFITVAKKHTTAIEYVSLYAMRFVEDLNSAGKSLNDLSGSQEAIEEMCMEAFPARPSSGIFAGLRTLTGSNFL